MTTSSDQSATHMRVAYVALICGGIIAALSFGTRSGFGVFLGPISDAMGTGRESFALSMALQNLVWGITQPFVGALADKQGPFRALFMGAVLYALGTVLMAWSGGPLAFHFSAGLLIGVAMAGTSFGILLTAVGKLFPPEKRTWAMGVTGAAGSFGQFVMLPASQWLLNDFGWSKALAILACLVTLMMPLALVFRRLEATAEEDRAPKQSIKEALSEAAGYGSFWFLAMGFFVCGFHVAFIAVHLPSYVRDIGLTAEIGALSLSLVGLFNIIGGYSAGVLGSKFSKKGLLSMLYFGRALVITAFLLLPPTELVVYGFACIMGLFWLSTVPLTSALVGQIFGVRYMGMLFGVVFLSHQIGAFIGAWLGGYMFDTTGSYNMVWWIAVALAVFSGLMHLPVNEKPIRRMATA